MGWSAVSGHLRLAAVWIAVLVTPIHAACVSGDDACPPESSQEQSAGAFVLFTTCVGCHSSQLEGDARLGAPLGMDFDDTDVVRSMADDIYRTANEGSMPPPTAEVPALSEAQVEALRVYLECGVE